MRRHNVKKQQNYAAFDYFGSVASNSSASRMDKLKAMSMCGYVICKKSSNLRVDKAFNKAITEIGSVVKRDDDQRMSRNQRR